MGFVVNIRGEKSHQIVRSGLEILVNLTHRGACGCDPLTGDGAGILTQIPHEFFAGQGRPNWASRCPRRATTASARCFCRATKPSGDTASERFEAIVAEEGQVFLGWRDVPVDNSVMGRTARDVEPVIRQMFVARGAKTPADMFEWKLYVIRKRHANRNSRDSDLAQKKYCYVPSLSSRVIVYKGLLLADQVERFYADLADERFVSALALVHQRYSTNTFPTWDLAHPFRYLAHNGEINTLRGNVNWMHARESMFASEKYGADLKKICPVCIPGASDSAMFDNALELLVLTGRSLPAGHVDAHSRAVAEPREHVGRAEGLLRISVVPDGAVGRPGLDGLYRRHADRRRARSQRPAAQPLLGDQGRAGGDGLGSRRARHSARGSRVRRAACARAACSWSTRPQGRIIADDEIKTALAARQPYRQWLKENLVKLDDLPRRGRRSTATWTSRCSSCSARSATRWKICGS